MIEVSRFTRLLPALLSMVALTGCARQETPHLGADAINSGDTAFILIAAAFVMLMTPALGLFYGGLVRSKNVLSVLMHCAVSAGIVTLLWVFMGYSIAFGPSSFASGEYSFLGNFQWAFLGSNGVGFTPSEIYASTIPHKLFMFFQGMFAVIAAAIICGAVAERMKFKTFCVFIVLWVLLIYCPLAHWVWSDKGWLKTIGSIDFAGGAVVHMSSGITALIAALLIKPRIGFPRTPMLPHNLVYTYFGAGLLWFGWFGFNAGSAGSAGFTSAVAFTSTHCAAAAGILGWMIYDWILRKKPTLLGAASGAIAGLVGITPACGFVSPLSGAVIGLVTSVVCAFTVSWRAKKGIDDSLDAFGIHGMGGLIGSLLTGIFASAAIDENLTGNQGLIFGDAKLFLMQIVATVVTILYTVPVAYVILKVLDKTLGLRVSSDEEQRGLDITQHEESAYNS